MSDFTLLVPMALFIGSAYSLTKELLQAKNWASTTGKILESQVDTKPSFVSSSIRRNFVLRYCFNTNGAEYCGSRFSLGPLLFHWPAYLDGLVQQYPVGSEVTVYFDPRNPHSCCLRREGWAAVIIMFFITVIITGIVYGLLPAS